MTETEARAVLLVRSLERDPSPVWSEADAAWASAEAQRAEGERSPFERFLARRASIAITRLTQRDPKFGSALAALGPHAWLNRVAVLLAFALGVATDAIGPSDRINILAPPLLAVLVWNLIVYLVLLARSMGGLRAGEVRGPLRGLLSWAIGKLEAGGPLGHFVPTWLHASRALQGARIAVLLHACSAALVVGVLLSFYTRGIAFEYRAGWDSTFLTADTVRR